MDNGNPLDNDRTFAGEELMTLDDVSDDALPHDPYAVIGKPLALSDPVVPVDNRKPSQGPGGKPRPKHIVERRRRLIEQMMLEGIATERIVDYVPTQYAGSERQIREDIAIVNAKWAKTATADLLEIKGAAVSRLLTDRQRYAKDKAWTAHAAATRELHKIQGLTGPEITLNQNTFNGPTQINISTEEAEHHARALLDAIDREKEEQKALASLSEVEANNGK